MVSDEPKRISYQLTRQTEEKKKHDNFTTKPLNVKCHFSVFQATVESCDPEFIICGFD